ncbi:glycosyltransferase family 2 protein [Helicobacter mesocricetorum]|uniref:glycosyltransferase family 2 protein n=1 Tax=Helicobacter mesocricetorum TaxID=87012 RepID=UPI000CF1C467|nr:glycosyltransferase family A protein [Helicobacter mesocricetorum]
MSPRISILSPSFNHEKFVGYFIESVLNQTFEDFELIIVDDCSTDRNVEEIRKFQDPRIKLIIHPFNQGINAALNTAFKASSGELLVFCASDDILYPNALEVIYHQINRQDILVLYTQLQVIDENNHLTNKTIFPKKDSRHRLLHYLFMEGNCLTSPGMCVKARAFESLYPLNVAMCNQQDCQMHILLLLQGEVGFVETPLVQYRRMSPKAKEKNISVKDKLTLKRVDLEIAFVMDTFLTCKDIALLQEVFKGEIQRLGLEPRKETLEFFLGFMALQSPHFVRKVWGYHIIMRFLNDSGLETLKSHYNFTFKDYLSLVLYVGGDKNFGKYQKYKKYFNISLIVLGLSLVLNVLWIFRG